MSSRLDELAERRRLLLALSDQRRSEMGALFGGLEGKLAAADTVVTAARRWRHHRFLIPAAMVALMVVPVVARNWVRRALWLMPLAVEGYRITKKRT